MNERRVLQRGRGRNQNIHRGNVGGRAGPQANRFAPDGFIHVKNLIQQDAITAQFSGAGRRIHAELMQPEFKLIQARMEVPVTTASSSNRA